jgi:hypothetical protein
MKWLCINTIKENEKILLMLFSGAKHFSIYRINGVVRGCIAKGGNTLEH